LTRNKTPLIDPIACTQLGLMDFTIIKRFRQAGKKEIGSVCAALCDARDPVVRRLCIGKGTQSSTIIIIIMIVLWVVQYDPQYDYEA